MMLLSLLIFYFLIILFVLAISQAIGMTVELTHHDLLSSSSYNWSLIAIPVDLCSKGLYVRLGNLLLTSSVDCGNDIFVFEVRGTSYSTIIDNLLSFALY
jgi:hypothetical protein